MPLLNTRTLAERLLVAERDLDGMGWGQPDYLFALSGPHDELQLELWMELPSGVTPFLKAIVALEMIADEEVRGLVVSTCGTGPTVDTLGLPPMGGLRDMCSRADIDPDSLAALLPRPRFKVVSQRRSQRALLGVLRRGGTAVVVHEAGMAAKEVDVLPRQLGDHQLLAELCGKVLG